MSTVIAPRHTDWIQTFTGRQFFPLEPRAEDIDILDIAHALSNLCRYGGHVEQFYSVAQHCYLVSKTVPYEFALYGLLHDASEAYLIDVPRPIKHGAGMELYRAAEKNLESLIYTVFGLGPEQPECVKTADNQLLRTEQRDLMKPAPAAWKDYRVGALEMKISPWTPHTAEVMYMRRYSELMKAVDPKSEAELNQGERARVSKEITASWFECGWGEYEHRLSVLLWDRKPPEDYLRKVEYVGKRRDIAARREDEQRIAAGMEPLWFLK
jgi:5'-deoxynucleotidase YfbR-like HD superfamily hydrolase